jgi:methylmalonyl-CoA mutase cobalamin-binding domain/chain
MADPRDIDLTAARMRPASDLIAEGRALARDWRVGPNRFLRTAEVGSEAEYKRRCVAAGRIMQHAHIGFRSVARTREAITEVHGACAACGVTVDRFGITLDWSMGYPAPLRSDRPRGTGIVLDGPEDFLRITDAAPAAAHFGDFMMGLPGAVENTKAAIAAGATAIGNLGQYFTFRLPYWDDDVATTEATVVALGLLAAQEAEILVHSNLDDGFAGLFADASAALGMVLLEKYVVEDLVGASVSHCYGHHFTAPHLRLAFHRALSEISATPGTMIYGSTVSYQSTAADNFASLASYLQADIWALNRRGTGHAVNPVPVTENERIPDVDEIIDVQIFAGRLAEHAASSAELIDLARVDDLAVRLVEGGRAFAGNVLGGLPELGVDITDAAQVMLALRRIGPRRLERFFGAGPPDPEEWSGRRTIVRSEWLSELEGKADRWVDAIEPAVRSAIAVRRLAVCVGTSDVHEHGKTLVEKALSGLGVMVIDGGVSSDPEILARRAAEGGADVIAISTYNGVALRYTREVLDWLAAAGLAIPVCVGGRLNQTPEDSNSGLPVDVTDEIRALGAEPCASLDALASMLTAVAGRRAEKTDQSGPLRAGPVRST